MTFQDDIILTTLQAKDTTGIWAECFIKKEARGDKVDKCCLLQLVVLVKWIGLAECYYTANFSANGNITPAYPCLTLAEMQELLSKMKALIGV